MLRIPEQHTAANPGRLSADPTLTLFVTNNAHSYNFRQFPVLIGRSRVHSDYVDCGPNALSINNAFLSRRHARIDLAERQARITDLGSSNGTFVNGKRVVATTVLKEGDLIRFGEDDPLVEGERGQAVRCRVSIYRSPSGQGASDETILLDLPSAAREEQAVTTAQLESIIRVYEWCIIGLCVLVLVLSTFDCCNK